MQHYELMYIVDPSAEEGFDEVKTKIEGIITGREGQLISFDKLGKKRLAYPIGRRQFGAYFLVNFHGSGKIVQALDYYLRLSTIVIRHLILVFSEKELALRERTSAVQLEEAERMKAGGRPLSKEEVGEVLLEEPIIEVEPELEALDNLVPDIDIPPEGESEEQNTNFKE